MGTSYVEYAAIGFWTGTVYLSDWLTTLIRRDAHQGTSSPLAAPTHRPIGIQTEIDGGCMALDLDSFWRATTSEKIVLAASESALERIRSVVNVPAAFLARLREEIETEMRQPY